jgi:hypothetical protein
MDNLEMVFLGTHTFTFTLPSTAEVEKKNYETRDVPGFEAVCTFRRLDELLAAGEPAFTYAQAVCVSEVEDYDSRGIDFVSVLVSHEAVRWVLCFPLVQHWDENPRANEYAPRTNSVPPDGDDMFYTFASTASPGAPVQAVPDLDSLKFLSPQPGDKLVVIRASDWHWDKQRDTVFILPEDVIEVETVSGSEVRVPSGAPRRARRTRRAKVNGWQA